MLCYNVSTAKAQLGEIRRAALDGHEVIITNTKNRNNNNQSVSVIASSLLDSIIEHGCKFSFMWTKEEGDEDYTLYVPEVDVFGVGQTKEAAIESLIDAVQEYAELYFGDLRFYMSPTVHRENHFGYLRRIIRCDGDFKRLRSVLGL